MTDRIYLGYSGGNPIFRLSRPGKDISSSDIADIVLREDSLTFRPSLSGTKIFAGNGSQSVTLSGFSAPPYVMLKSNDSFPPHFFDYYAKLNDAFTSLSIVNVRNIARTITYYVFQNTM